MKNMVLCILRIFYIITLSLVCNSCVQTQDSAGTGPAKPGEEAVDIASLERRVDGRYQDGAPYTGEAFWHGNKDYISTGRLVGGKESGTWVTVYLPTDTIVSEEHYQAGKLDGSVKTWYKNGRQKSSAVYSSGVKHGLTRCWSEDGTVEYECNFVKGKRDGDQVQVLRFRRAPAFGTQTITFRQGVKVSTVLKTSDGEAFHGEYRNNKPWNGVFLTEFPWGRRTLIDVTGPLEGKVLGSYKEGVLDGPIRWYRSDFSQLCKGTYKNGLPDSGTIAEQKSIYLWALTQYRDAQPDGTVQYFWVYYRDLSLGEYQSVSPSKLQKEGRYRKGLKWSGTFIDRYAKRKKVWCESVYQGGKPIKETYTCIYSGMSDEFAKEFDLLPVQPKE